MKFSVCDGRILMAEASLLVPWHSLHLSIECKQVAVPQRLGRLEPCQQLHRGRYLRPFPAHPHSVSGVDILQVNVEKSSQLSDNGPHQLEEWNPTEVEKKLEPLKFLESSSLNRQSLLKFPTKHLKGKVVLVRCDFNFGPTGMEIVGADLQPSSIPTLSYLSGVGCKVVVVTHWKSLGTAQSTMETALVADALSRNLNLDVLWVDAVAGEEVKARIRSLQNGNILLLGNLKLYKEEDANDAVFSSALTDKVDHFVNDAFRVSHRALASTVGAATSTCARLAGLQLEKELFFMRKIREGLTHPFVAIIGGSRLSEQADVLKQMLGTCDKIFVTGPMAYTMLKAAGIQIPLPCIEQDMISRARKLLQYAREKKVELVLPKDFTLEHTDSFSRSMNISVSCPVPEGWQLIDLGQESYECMLNSVQDSKLVLWLGACTLGPCSTTSKGMRLLAEGIGRGNLHGCVTIVGGKEVVGCLTQARVIHLVSHVCHTGGAFWQLLKGRTLPGLAALDPASPPSPDWSTVFEDPHLPLTVDIGSGNGLFIFRMAKLCKQRNFLGLENFRKLVERCLETVAVEQLSNTHFMAVNATSSFQSIIATYPGKVALVAIQCPDPNFSKPTSRWRMVQRQLVEAITSTLCPDGLVFLQSDVKAVLEAMLAEFETHAKGLYVLSSEHCSPRNCDENGWLNVNPLEASTDWEDHALQRGRQMYRVLLVRLKLF